MLGMLNKIQKASRLILILRAILNAGLTIAYILCVICFPLFLLENLMWNALIFSVFFSANAAPLDVEAVVLRYPRDPQGISVAILELQPVFQTCIDHIPVEGNPGTLLTRMHFSIAPEGYVQSLQVILAAANPALQDCLSNPLKELRFASGAQSQPVEIPFRLKIVGNTTQLDAPEPEVKLPEENSIEESK